MKFRLGFVSNSSSSSFVFIFPKNIKDKDICKAKLRTENPPGRMLAKATGYEHIERWVKQLEEFVKDLKILKQTKDETIFELDIPFYIFRTYDSFMSKMRYWYENDAEYYGRYKNSFNKYAFGSLSVSNESEDTLLELIYFLGLVGLWIELHPEIEIIGGD